MAQDEIKLGQHLNFDQNEIRNAKLPYNNGEGQEAGNFGVNNSGQFHYIIQTLEGPKLVKLAELKTHESENILQLNYREGVQEILLSLAALRNTLFIDNGTSRNTTWSSSEISRRIKVEVASILEGYDLGAPSGGSGNGLGYITLTGTLEPPEVDYLPMAIVHYIQITDTEIKLYQLQDVNEDDEPEVPEPEEPEEPEGPEEEPSMMLLGLEDPGDGGGGGGIDIPVDFEVDDDDPDDGVIPDPGGGGGVPDPGDGGGGGIDIPVDPEPGYTPIPGWVLIKTFKQPQAAEFTGTEIPLNNTLGSFNVGEANEDTIYTLAGTPVLGAWAEILINTTTQPGVTGATHIGGGDEWETGVDMYMRVKYNGRRAEYYFIKAAAD